MLSYHGQWVLVMKIINNTTPTNFLPIFLHKLYELLPISCASNASWQPFRSSNIPTSPCAITWLIIRSALLCIAAHICISSTQPTFECLALPDHLPSGQLETYSIIIIVSIFMLPTSTYLIRYSVLFEQYMRLLLTTLRDIVNFRQYFRYTKSQSWKSAAIGAIMDLQRR